MSNNSREDQELSLLEAVQQGKLRRVNSLLDKGLDPNYMDDEGGYTLVHWAVQEGHPKIIKSLFEHGANLDAKFLDSITPLLNACGMGNLSVIKTLVELGAAINTICIGGTALHNAVAFGDRDIVKYLVEKGAEINAVDSDGRTPLFSAIEKGNEKLVNSLLKWGAKKDVQDNEGNSPLDEAKSKKLDDIAKLLY